MIRINLTDLAAADRLIEALYVAAGQRRGTRQAAEWYDLAAQIESGIDALPTAHPFGDEAEQHAIGRTHRHLHRGPEEAA